MFCAARIICDTTSLAKNLRLTQVATVMFLKIPPTYDHIELPERRRLPPFQRKPIIPADMKYHPMTKKTSLIRGPETVHNKLQYGQYGIQAREGGNIQFGHIEMLRMGINRRLEEKRMFAVWRIDAPWRPVTKKTLGSRMGGGKGPIKYYVTPVKAERIILELGGHLEFFEARLILRQFAEKLPFRARVVSKTKLEEEEKLKKELEEQNLNPFSFLECAKKNYLGIQMHLSPYDFKFKGRYK